MAKSFMFVLLAFACIEVQAGEVHFQCPSSLTITQSGTAPGAEWEAVSDKRALSLLRAGFYLHHPSQGGSLVPDSTKRTKSEETSVWTFPRNPGDDFWLGCHYNDSTVILARRLGDNISKCSVKYSLLPSGERDLLKDIICS